MSKTETTKTIEEKTTRIKYTDDMVIHFGVDKEGNRVGPENNPKRQGSRSFEQFDLYAEGMTVKEFLDLGGSRASINWDVEKGFIEVKEPSKAKKKAA